MPLSLSPRLYSSTADWTGHWWQRLSPDQGISHLHGPVPFIFWLALTTGEVGFVYGTVGILMLTLGGLLCGFVAARQGLKYWIWWMVLAINRPNAF